MNVSLLTRRLARTVFHGLFLALPLIFTSVNEELFEFNKLLVIYASAIVLLCLWGVHTIMQKKLVLPKTPFDIPIFLFVGSQVISTVFSIHPYTSLFGYYTRFNGGLFSILAYVICFYAFVIFVDRKYIRSLLTTLLIGGGLAALYAFPEHFGHSPSCLLLTGSFDVTCWVQDVRSRVFGTFGQPNWLAAYVLMVIPVTISMVIESVSRKGKPPQVIVPSKQRTLQPSIDVRVPKIDFTLTKEFIFSSILFCLFGSVLLFTGSRSGLLGMGITFAVYIGMVLIIWLRNRQVGLSPLRLPLTLIISSVVIFAVLLIGFGSPALNLPSLQSRFISAPKTTQETARPTGGTQLEVGGSDSGKIRQVVWKGAVQVWKRYPLFGSGVETFGYSYFKDRPVEHNLLSEWDFLYNKAHNEFLNYLATTGIVGLSTYVLMYGGFILLPLLWAIKVHKRSDSQSAFLLLALSSGLSGLAVSNFFGFSTVVVSFLTFIFPAISYCVYRNEETVGQKILVTNKHLNSNQWTAGGIVALLGCIGLFLVFRMWKADELYAKGKTLYNQNDLGNAIEHLQRAVDLSPGEAMFHDELSYVAAKGAVTLGLSGESTAAGELATFAISESDIAQDLNPVHTNIIKTRARMFLMLAQLSPTFYTQAVQVLQEARELSPTDSKLVYNLALIAKEQGNDDLYRTYLEEAIKLRPVDEPARFAYGQYLEEKKEVEKAKEQYQYMLQFINPENQLVKDRLASLSATPKK